MRIRKQVRLGSVRTLEICLNGIYYRLFRSLITVAVVSVAIAFMMYMLAGSVIGTTVHLYAQAEARRYKSYDRWLSWIEQPMGRRSLFRTVAACEAGDPKIRSVGQWGSFTPAQAEDLRTVAQEGEAVLRFLDSLPPGQRLRLVEGQGGEFLLDWLLSGPAYRQFTERLAQMRAAAFPLAPVDLRALLTRYRAQIPQWDAIESGRNAAITRLQERYPGRRAAELLASPPPDFAATLAELGFSGGSDDFASVAEAAARAEDLFHVSALLRNSALRRDLSRQTGIRIMKVNPEAFAKLYLSREGPALVEAMLRRNDLYIPLEKRRLRDVLADYLKRSRILRIEARSKAFAGGAPGHGSVTLWLIGVSFVVCIVGIANAMLMSVMERFREIATMKCLGATDGFVMVLFVMESCFQGFVGGLCGAALGLLLAVPFSVLRYGSLVWSVFPWHDVCVTALVSLGAGVLLAGIASVYPAYVAARLAPMEAMRLE